jgi:hypothetical protein
VYVIDGKNYILNENYSYSSRYKTGIDNFIKKNKIAKDERKDDIE